MATDATFAALTIEIDAAAVAMDNLARTEPELWWSPYDLRQQARNGWTAGAMGLALDRLIASGRLEVNADLEVRASK